MKIIFALSLITINLIGCTSAPPIYQPSKEYQANTLLFDSHFPNYSDYVLETEEDIFYIDKAVAAKARNLIFRRNNLKNKSQELVDFLFDEEYINLQYDDSANYTAQEAIENKRANCITLTILAFSLAKHSQILAQFQDVDVPEYWNRTGQYSLLTGHVNLVLKSPQVNFRDDSINLFSQNTYVVDFDPLINSQKFPSRYVNKTWVMAMFYNNKGAQALMHGNQGLAYAYFKQAVTVASDYAPSWVNLAVLFRQNSLLDKAKNIYEHAINLDPKNYAAISNLAIVLRKLNNSQQADELMKKLHKIRYKNPFYHKALGDNALYQKRYELAKEYYEQAIELDDQKHEFYYGLAKAYVGLNNKAKAKKLLDKAMRLNNYVDINEIYLAKSHLLSR